jgi:predicted ester cyclase
VSSDAASANAANTNADRANADRANADRANADRAVVLDWVARWNPRGVAGLDQLAGPSYVHHAQHGGDLDLAGFKAGLLAVLAAFPDLVYEVGHTVSEGGLVAAYLRATGSQTGPYFGVQPAGATVTFTGIYHARVADERIAEDWDVFDLLTPLLRLGATIQP